MLRGIGQFIRGKLGPSAVEWPFVRGTYSVIDATAPVILATTSPSALPKTLSSAPPAGLSMVAVLHTPADAAKLLRAIAANLSVQCVICLEAEKAKQPLGAVLLNLGRDEEPAAPAIRSLMSAVASQVDSDDLGVLRRRVEFVDMLRSTDAAKVIARIEECAAAALHPNAGFVTRGKDSAIPRLILPRDTRYEARHDKAGKFKIRLEEHSIAVDHLNAKGELLRIIEGKTARDICLALIRNGWVSKLDHAAYLGRELARAEVAMRSGRPFMQDDAEPNDAPQPIASER